MGSGSAVGIQLPLLTYANNQEGTKMDPDTALETLRQAARYDGPMTDADRLELLVENFTALDEWLSRGGFKPKAWS